MDLRLVAVLAAMFALSCAARHRKPSGPPPEYELPEAPDAWTPAPIAQPRDAGTQ